MEEESSQDVVEQTSNSSPVDIKPCIERNGSSGVNEDDEPDRRCKNQLPPWSGASWQDGSRRSAFQPYRVFYLKKCQLNQPTTVLTNLQRGNVQTLTPVLEPIDVSLHHRAGQGEITVEELERDSEIDEEDSNGLTPLHWASSYGQLPTTQLLLRKGAAVDREGPEGETPLQLAAAGGHHDTVRLLLAEGADVNHIDETSCPKIVILVKEVENCNTALMYAAYGDHPHCVNELLLRGADLTMVNLNSDTAYGVAIARGSKQAQAVFENHIMLLLTQQ
ncbi:hypothetical protein B566_EDAN008456 [Ephemera danica]|nr:hypothetical protein B566_EDAN008456 [Ephemera danica]